MTATDERRDMKRKLTTIFCADVSGYSRMMGADEARTLTTLKEYRQAIEGFIARHHGRVVSWSGDGLLAEFASVVEAVQCAAEVQRELKARNASRDENLRMSFRIGINLGDVMADGDDIFGEGVNIAARLQQMASPGGILVSSPVYDQVRGKLSMGFAALGNQSVKNIAGEIAIYAVTMDGVAPHVQVAGPRWRDEDEAPPAAPPRRARLFRRGLAVLADYMIVVLAVLAGALILNTSVSPTIVRMDLDVPFIDYGDVVDRTPWVVTSQTADGRMTITHDERVVTYDYLGLFTQTYRQSRTRGRVASRSREERREERRQQRSEQPARDSGDAPPVAAPEPIPSPPPPPPPEPPAPAAPPPPGGLRDQPVITTDPATGTTTYSLGGVSVEVGPSGLRTSNGFQVSRDGVISSVPDARADDGADGERGTSLAITDDRRDGFSVRFNHVSEQLLDATNGQPITRPSLDLLSLLLLVLYFAVLEAGRRGTTVGKKAFDLAVTREDGQPVGFPTALVRNAIKVLSVFILPIAVLFVLLSRRRQGIHDRLARTVVVEESR